MAMVQLSRRRVLQSSAVGLAGALSPGCAQLPTSAAPSVRRTTETYTADSVTSDWRRADASPVSTNLFTEEEAMRQSVDTDVLPEMVADDLYPIDFSERFVTVFQTRLRLHARDRSVGSCPRLQYADGTVTYHVPLRRWPAELSGERGVHVSIDVWEDPDAGAERVRADLSLGTDESRRVCVESGRD